MSVRVVCISDTHNRVGRMNVPDGDVLVHAGDSTMMGTVPEVGKFAAYLEALPHKHKVVIAGNHDWLFAREPERARRMIEDAGAVYLQDTEATVAGLRFYGSPWQPRFHDWAFNVDRGAAIRAKWAFIPEGLDFLITHGPPFGILDTVEGRAEHLGCRDLLHTVLCVRPRYHVFGHIHTGAGQYVEDAVTFVNASICDEAYAPTQKPAVLDVEASNA